jgi:hypothetical protein
MRKVVDISGQSFGRLLLTDQRISVKGIDLFGVKVTQKEAAVLFGYNQSVVSSRMRAGWTAEEALTIPTTYAKKNEYYLEKLDIIRQVCGR